MNRLLVGDVLVRLRELPDESVDVVATSPPYFGLRSYLPVDDPNKGLEIGAEETPKEYIARLVEVGREIWRILKPSGTWWVNIGDSYANDGKWGGASGGKHAAALHSETGVGRGKVSTGLKPKDLIGIPYMLAFALRDAGWYWRSNIVWAKATSGDVREGTAMPESTDDRPQCAHETILLMTKGQDYYYDAFAVREPASSTHGSGNGYKREKRESFVNADGTYRGSDVGWQAGPGATGHLRNVWRINPKAYKGSHYAVWPAALIEQILKAGAPPKTCAACGVPWRRLVGRTCTNPQGCTTLVPSRTRVCGTCGYDKKLASGAAEVPVPPHEANEEWAQIGLDRAATSHFKANEAMIANPLRAGDYVPACSCSCPAVEPRPGVVLDPFIGSGTTAAVAERMGLRWIGIDLDKRNALLLEERVLKENPSATWEVSHDDVDSQVEGPVVPPSSTRFGPILDLAAWREDVLRRVDGRLLAVSVSGGKDSTAVLCLLKAAGIPFQAFHMDTAWEHEDTEKYVREYLPQMLGIEIKVLSGYPGGMEALILDKGMFPSRQIRFCTQELKTEPARRHLASLIAAGEAPINVVGIRREEGTTGNDRGTAAEWDYSSTYECDVWRPLVDWTLDDVIAAHEALGVLPNPLYLRGAERVGCFPCIFVSKPEMRFIADSSPERIARMARLEARVGELARERERVRTMAALEVRRAGGSRASAVQAALDSGTGHPAAETTLERMLARIDVYLAGGLPDPMDGWNAPAWFQARISSKSPTNQFRCNGRGCKARFSVPAEQLACPAEWNRDHAKAVRTLSATEVASAVDVGWLEPPTAHVEGCGGTTWRRHVIRSGEPWAIDKVVEWSRTKRGGKVADDLDADLFTARQHEQGCARWGLCEVPVERGALKSWVEKIGSGT